MTKITDMLGQEVQVGDRIAAAFRYRPFNGTIAELRTGIVVDIVQRQSTYRGGGLHVEDALKVEWDYSSEETTIQDYLRDRHERACEKAGHPVEPPKFLGRPYKKKTSAIMVSNKRFIKVG